MNQQLVVSVTQGCHILVIMVTWTREKAAEERGDLCYLELAHSANTNCGEIAHTVNLSKFKLKHMILFIFWSSCLYCGTICLILKWKKLLVLFWKHLVVFFQSCVCILPFCFNCYVLDNIFCCALGGRGKHSQSSKKIQQTSVYKFYFHLDWRRTQ
jgi:hypothetical protein